MIGINKDVVIHFIGIGGIGMSGIARVLINLGYSVTGSDLNESENTQLLKKMGASIYIDHNKENIGNASIIVHTSAVDPKNPEMMEAKLKSIPIIQRAEMLAELMRLKYGIAVAGTHGKTTTTSIVSTIFEKADLKATHIVGGIVKNLDTHAKLGEGEILIAEADESDGSFLLLNPILAIVTNIDNDHLDFYKSTEKLKESFLTFINKIPFYGTVAINIDDANIREIVQSIKKPFITFGIDSKENVNFRAHSLENTMSGTKFLIKKNGKDIGEFELPMWGRHNVLNALGAIAIADKYGVDLNVIKEAIKGFKGVGRRLEKIENNFGLDIYDDYGHHPTEISSTINALKLSGRKVFTFFEPHRYTRTRDCWKEFLHCFNQSDKVYMLPIYPANEEPISGITSESLVEDINKIHPDKINLVDYSHIKDILLEIARDTIVLSLGAGPISKKFRSIVNE